MSHLQFHSTNVFILRHAWLNLWDKHMTTGRINQVTVVTFKPNSDIASLCRPEWTEAPSNNKQHNRWFQLKDTTIVRANNSKENAHSTLRVLRHVRTDQSDQNCSCPHEEDNLPTSLDSKRFPLVQFLTAHWSEQNSKREQNLNINQAHQDTNPRNKVQVNADFTLSPLEYSSNPVKQL